MSLRWLKIATLLIPAFGAGVWYSGWTRSRTQERRILFYRDPMHPAYISYQPGIAPDCGMPLVPVYSDDPAARTSDPVSGNLRPRGVHISAGQRQIAGIKVGSAKITAEVQTIRSLGRVAVDETRRYRVNAATDGWIEKTPPLAVGSFVERDQRLAVYHTRELRSAAQAYLYTVDRLNHRPDPKGAVETDIDRRGLEIALETLRVLGMSDSQIHEMEVSGHVPQDIELRSPASGFVLARSVSPGQRFNRGDELYTIADLSRIWILADLFENDAAQVRCDSPARVLVGDSRAVIESHVSESLPQFDGVSKTFRIRLSVENPKFALKPEMFVGVEFPITLPPSLTVPRDAIVDSGLAGTVFVDLGDGYFEPRIVKTGWHTAGRIQILTGLSAGDRIAESGTFLIDSEARMRSPASIAAYSDGHRPRQ